MPSPTVPPVIRALLDQSFDVMGVCNAEGRVLYVNAAAERVTGYSADQFNGHVLAQWLHPEDLPKVRQAVAAEDATARLTLLIRLRHADGRWIKVEATGRRVADEGTPVWLVCLRSTGPAVAEDELLQLERDLLVELADCPTSERALKAVLKAARRLGGVDGGGVYRYDAEHKLLHLVVADGLPAAFIRAVSLYDSSRKEMQLAKRGQPLYVTDEADSSVGEILRRWKIRMIAVLPIVHERRLRGVLNLATAQPQGFSVQARLALEVLARHAGQIIDRIEDARARRESEERYRELVESSPDGVAVHVNGHFVYANQAAAQLCGVPKADDLLGQPILDYIAPELRQAARERIGWLLAEGGRITRAESCLCQPGGKRVPCELSGTRVSFNGQPAIQTVIHDLSGLRESAGLLLASESRLRAVFEGITEGFLIFLPDGTLSYANPVALADKPSDGLANTWAGHARRVAQQRQRLALAEVIVRNGVSHEIESSWVPIVGEGGVVQGVSCVYRDVTERLRLATERRLLAQRLLEVQEQERKTISAFLHDHMGPLVIMAKIELEQLTRVLPKKHLPQIKLVVDRLDDTLRGIRHRALAVRPPLLDDLEVSDALEYLVEEFSRSHGLNVTMSPVPRVPSVSPAIKTCLYRVLQEALHNVLTHAQAKSTVVTAAQREQTLHMSIRDDGIGFDVALVSPVDRLGLIGMREIVESLGGTLGLNSCPGKGTLVEVTVPVEKTEGENQS